MNNENVKYKKITSVSLFWFMTPEDLMLSYIIRISEIQILGALILETWSWACAKPTPFALQICWYYQISRFLIRSYHVCFVYNLKEQSKSSDQNPSSWNSLFVLFVYLLCLVIDCFPDSGLIMHNVFLGLPLLLLQVMPIS